MVSIRHCELSGLASFSGMVAPTLSNAGWRARAESGNTLTLQCESSRSVPGLCFQVYAGDAGEVDQTGRQSPGGLGSEAE